MYERIKMHEFTSSDQPPTVIANSNVVIGGTSLGGAGGETWTCNLDIVIVVDIDMDKDKDKDMDVDIDMQHVQVHAACPCPLSMSISVLLVMSILHVHVADEETNESYPITNGLNGLVHLCIDLLYICREYRSTEKLK
jgi:hypothetical protein